MADEPTLVEELTLDSLPDDPPDFDACEEGGDALVAARGLISPRQVLVTWLPAAFDKWGAKYRLVAGWEDRGRPPSSGGFDPRGRVLVHHTGSTSSEANPHPALGTVTKGRPDLTGPLCQISTDHNGVTSIVAAGRANHAGKAKAVGSAPAGDGNELWIGNEVDTSGAQTMPQAQYDAIVLTTCAIFDHEGIAPGEVADNLALHNTTSLSGKWDLGAGDGRSGIPYPVRDLRADVAARLAAGPPTTTEGFLMALSDEQQLDIYNRVMGGLPDGKAAGRKDSLGRPTRLLDTADGETIIGKTALDPAKLAAAVASLLPAGAAVPDDQLERVLRKVIGSVDDVTA